MTDLELASLFDEALGGSEEGASFRMARAMQAARDAGLSVSELGRILLKGDDAPTWARIRMQFGKHKNETIWRIYVEDPGYLCWVYENVEKLDPVTRAAINKLILQPDIADIAAPQ